MAWSAMGHLRLYFQLNFHCCAEILNHRALRRGTSPSPTRTRAHTGTHTQVHTHRHTHRHTQAHSHTHRHTRALTQTAGEAKALSHLLVSDRGLSGGREGFIQASSALLRLQRSAACRPCGHCARGLFAQALGLLGRAIGGCMLAWAVFSKTGRCAAAWRRMSVAGGALQVRGGARGRRKGRVCGPRGVPSF